MKLNNYYHKNKKKMKSHLKKILLFSKNEPNAIKLDTVASLKKDVVLKNNKYTNIYIYNLFCTFI